MIRPAFLWVVLVVCTLLAQPAAADPITLRAGINLDFLDGKHETGGGAARITFIPLPLVDADARFRRTSLHLEGLPSVTFGYGNGSIEGASSTRLSLFTGTLRHYLTGSFYVGVGQTLYNQRTAYNVLQQTTPFRTLSQESRVTGARFEAGLDRPISSSTHMRIVVALNPVMHGVQYSTVATAVRACSFNSATPAPASCPLTELADPERASQADISITFAKHLHHGELVYGLRYLDYVSHYSEVNQPGDGLLADRNVGVMPVIGWRVKL